MNGQNSSRAKDAVERLQTALFVGYLPEDRHEESDVEFRIRKGKLAGVATLVTDVSKTRRFELVPGLGEHLRLEIEQFEATARESPRDFDTEVSGAGPDFEDPGRRCEGKTRRKFLRGDEKTADGVVDDERELVGEVAYAGCALDYRAETRL
jgi:hypothetical protein